MGSWIAWVRRPFGLRLRLTLSYAILFTLLLFGLGVVFRQILASSLQRALQETLDEESSVVKSYLHFKNHKPTWQVDQDDEEEKFAFQRMHRIFFLADRTGTPLDVSDAYSYVQETPEQAKAMLDDLLKDPKPRWVMKQDQDGVPYLLRYSVLVDDGRRDFLMVIGRLLDTNEKVLHDFTKIYIASVPVLLIALSTFGWFLAGRALRPLNAVAQAAQEVTGHTLNLRITRRGADDELDHLIDKFNSMVDRLESSFNQIRRFSMDVSHELRTPLTAIRGELEVALLSAVTTEQYREAMVSAIEEVDRLSQIVRGLLHLSQAESGQVVLTKTVLDLSEVTAKMVEQYGMAAEMDELQMTSALEPGCHILGDRLQIERLEANLLSNAVKYTEAGGAVRVQVRKSPTGVELIIQDTGKGIASEHLPRIFDRFYRVPDGNLDPERGMGLGLSFVAWIAQAHDARIEVDSHPGKGTRFTVSFPAVPANAAQVPRPEIAALNR